MSHLDVGLAKRQTPCRFFETVQRFLPSFQGRWPFLIRRIRLQANIDIPEALVAGTSTPQGVLLFGLFRFEEAGGREKKKEKKRKKEGKEGESLGGGGFPALNFMCAYMRIQRGYKVAWQHLRYHIVHVHVCDLTIHMCHDSFIRDMNH